MLRVALAQMNACVGDLSGNSKKILEFLKRAREVQAEVILYPELAVTGYPPEDLLLKPDFIQDNVLALRALIKEMRGIVALIGFVDVDNNKNLFNAAAIVSDGVIRGVYHKQILPNYGVFDEKRYFAEGQQSGLFCVGQHPTGISICEDFWHLGEIPQAQAKASAKVLLNISSSPFDFDKFEQREKLLVNRAQKNKCYVCYCNMVGGQDELVFDGGSMILNPRGQILAAGKQFAEDLVVADLAIADKKPNPRALKKYIVIPSIKDKVVKKAFTAKLVERLNKVERIYRALVIGTQDYIRKNGFQKVVVGLSGGIDSSLVAAIAVAAVGKQNVVGVSMPSPFTSPETKGDARRVAQNLGIRFIEVPIHDVFQKYLEVLQPEFQQQPPDVTEENLQARIRGNILMAFSNKFGWLVLTTGNKSEVAVGYCTLYGDMTGGFAVIKDVPKTTVYDIAKFINQQENDVIPQSILTRPPTAELKKDQKDQDSLPPYEVLDMILKAYVEEHQPFSAMTKKFKDIETVKEVMQMIDRSEYKRRQSPPGIKITSRAFGKDWRLPITHKYQNFHTA
jgi:NAD+ synthase (glutamine-hydrolysing)